MALVHRPGDPSPFGWQLPVLTGVVFLGAAGIVLTAGGLPSVTHPLVQVADLAVGTAYLVLALLGRRRSPALAWLCVAVAATWWCGSFWAAAAFWHRGPLIHLLLTFPSAWPRVPWVRALVVLGYASGLVTWVWSDGRLAVLLAAGLLLAQSVRSLRLGPVRAVLRSPAWLATALVSGAVVTDSVARAVVPLGAAVRPSFVVFCGCLVGAAGALASGLRPPDPERVTDLVVQMGEHGGEGLRSQLAAALGDPTVQLAVERDGSFVDDSGSPVPIPDPGGDRRAVVVRRRDGPAVLVTHHGPARDEPALRRAVDRWAEMSAANARLRDRTQRSMAQVVASRRRLVVAADEERDLLARQLDHGVTGPLRSLGNRLAEDPLVDGPVLRRLESVIHRLDLAAGDLNPAGLADGIAAALRVLAADVPLQVSLDATESPVDPTVARAAYFVCAEAVTNAAKHARASRIDIRVDVQGPELVVEVSDDGCGGADERGGSGLIGLADRVAALGGVLVVDSPLGAGTTVRARLPC